MIQLIKETIEEIPVLHVVKENLHDECLPTIVYYHGYNGEKISSLTLAYKIAEQGYRVVLPDSIYHGDRNEHLTSTELDLAFWDIVTQNIKELSTLKNHLVETGRTIENRIGVGGTSMGAITTYGALCTYDWIKSAASLMGTAYMTDYARALIDYFNTRNETNIPKEQVDRVMNQIKPFDLTLQLRKLRERPLFIWHGETDKVVPYAYSTALYQALQEKDINQTSLHFVNEPGRGHHISRLAVEEASKWFTKHV